MKCSKMNVKRQNQNEEEKIKHSGIEDLLEDLINLSVIVEGTHEDSEPKKGTTKTCIELQKETQTENNEQMNEEEMNELIEKIHKNTELSARATKEYIFYYFKIRIIESKIQKIIDKQIYRNFLNFINSY